MESSTISLIFTSNESVTQKLSGQFRLKILFATEIVPGQQEKAGNLYVCGNRSCIGRSGASKVGPHPPGPSLMVGATSNDPRTDPTAQALILSPRNSFLTLSHPRSVLDGRHWRKQPTTGIKLNISSNSNIKINSNSSAVFLTQVMPGSCFRIGHRHSPHQKGITCSLRLLGSKRKN